jgi:hypothetical protein
MTQDEIIEMAKQAGFEDFNRWCEHYPQETQRWCQRMEAFAKLVAEKEREACAKIADEWAVGWPHPSQVIAERIRERT